jgi:hypothetical protein
MVMPPLGAFAAHLSSNLELRRRQSWATSDYPQPVNRTREDGGSKAAMTLTRQFFRIDAAEVKK